MRMLITGGAGFIGSAVTRSLIAEGEDEICVFDKLTYAGDLTSLEPIAKSSRYSFVHADVCDRKAVARAFTRFAPDVVLHLAAESHVDRSIDGPAAFIETNLVGTFTMLDVALEYWRRLDATKAKKFRFMHISTDEVFGTLGLGGCFGRTRPMRRTLPIRPRKRVLTISCALGARPTGYQRSSPTARTTTAPTTFPRSSFL